MRYKGFLMNRAVAHFMAGRIVRRAELPFSEKLIDCYIDKGLVVLEESIRVRHRFWGRKLTCCRCLNEQQRDFVHFNCARCQKKCVYCRHCISMGRVVSCEPLLRWEGPTAATTRKHELAFLGILTNGQRAAADNIIRAIKEKKSHLLHAVCGAGKTEILFEPIFFALEQNLRVCLATPRTDVVLELLPRLQSAFPNTNIHALYGSAPIQTGYAPLIIATTHQLYRFQQTFDVMIVDEADAFPYTFDATLQRAVEKAKKQHAPLIFVTATPSKKLLNNCQSASFIARRYHGFTLPVPTFEALFGYERAIHKGKLPAKLREWIEAKLADGTPFLLFFPTIDLMERALPLVQEVDAGILSVHASDVERKEKVMRLRAGEIRALLTTTILERGITIQNLQVAVIGAENAVFDQSALIQIAGRVGRHKDYATGDIVFFHHGISYAMDDAVAEIKRLNEVPYA